MNNKRLLALLVALGASMFSGCQSSGPSAPTASTSGARQQADAAVLASGRSLFVGRCARCHALPDVAEHSAEQWPRIVAHMAKRSGLRPNETEAVIAYVLTARSQ